MKIAFFTYTRLEYGGGVAKYMTDVSVGLMERFKDLDIDIVTFDKRSLKFLLFFYFIYFGGKQDMDLLDKEKSVEIKKKLGSVGYIKVSLFNLKNTLSEYDLIYTTNNLLEVMLFKYIVGYKYLPPIIYGVHIPVRYKMTGSIQSVIHNILYGSHIYKKALRGAWKIHVINNFDKKLLLSDFDLSNVIKIYNPFNFVEFKEAQTKNHYPRNWDRKKINILWVGRLTEQKGVNEHLDLIEKVNSGKYYSRVVWNVVGNGEFQRKVIKMSEKFQNVIYHGYVENRYIPDIMANNDLFISTSKWEGFPYTLLEAQTAGLPVIAFDIPGCNDVIDNGANGYFADGVNDLYNKTSRFLGRNDFNKNAIKKYILKKFNTEGIYRSLHKLLTYEKN